jgi:hypothetical protein
MTRRLPIHTAAAAIVLTPVLLWGCSSPAPRTQEVTAHGPQTSTAADPAPAKAETAEKVFEDIAQRVSTAKLVKVYTEEDDPNEMLGRPNGYTSKIAFSDSRISKGEVGGTDADAIERGGSIEVFPDEEGAVARAKYIQQMLKATGFGTEYDYVRGTVLVRVTGNLTPTKAKEYKAALG